MPPVLKLQSRAKPPDSSVGEGKGPLRAEEHVTRWAVSLGLYLLMLW